MNPDNPRRLYVPEKIKRTTLGLLVPAVLGFLVGCGGGPPEEQSTTQNASITLVGEPTADGAGQTNNAQDQRGEESSQPITDSKPAATPIPMVTETPENAFKGEVVDMFSVGEIDSLTLPMTYNTVDANGLISLLSLPESEAINLSFTLNQIIASLPKGLNATIGIDGSWSLNTHDEVGNAVQVAVESPDGESYIPLGSNNLATLTSEQIPKSLFLNVNLPTGQVSRFMTNIHGIPFVTFGQIVQDENGIDVFVAEAAIEPRGAINGVDNLIIPRSGVEFTGVKAEDNLESGQQVNAITVAIGANGGLTTYQINPDTKTIQGTAIDVGFPVVEIEKLDFGNPTTRMVIVAGENGRMQVVNLHTLETFPVSQGSTGELEFSINKNTFVLQPVGDGNENVPVEKETTQPIVIEINGREQTVDGRFSFENNPEFIARLESAGFHQKENDPTWFITESPDKRPLGIRFYKGSIIPASFILYDGDNQVEVPAELAIHPEFPIVIALAASDGSLIPVFPNDSRGWYIPEALVGMTADDVETHIANGLGELATLQQFGIDSYAKLREELVPEDDTIVDLEAARDERMTIIIKLSMKMIQDYNIPSYVAGKVISQLFNDGERFESLDEDNLDVFISDQIIPMLEKTPEIYIMGFNITSATDIYGMHGANAATETEWFCAGKYGNLDAYTVFGRGASPNISFFPVDIGDKENPGDMLGAVTRGGIAAVTIDPNKQLATVASIAKKN